MNGQSLLSRLGASEIRLISREDGLLSTLHIQSVDKVRFGWYRNFIKIIGIFEMLAVVPVNELRTAAA
jgi:hypothetical protein